MTPRTTQGSGVRGRRARLSAPPKAWTAPSSAADVRPTGASVAGVRCLRFGAWTVSGESCQLQRFVGLRGGFTAAPGTAADDELEEEAATLFDNADRELANTSAVESGESVVSYARYNVVNSYSKKHFFDY